MILRELEAARSLAPKLTLLPAEKAAIWRRRFGRGRQWHRHGGRFAEGLD